MGLFDVFKKKEEVTQKNIIDTLDKSDWLKVFSACLGKMMVIQNNASEYVVKGRPWNVDFGKGYISFGDDTYPVRFIGSESSSSNTWMWGWNNVNNFSDSLISLVNETLRKGEEWNLDPLRVPQFELDDMFNGHNLSIVACGVSQTNCFYYRGPHNGGAVFMAVCNAPKEVFSPIAINQFVNLTLQCVEQFPIDHKIFVESLLQWNKTPYKWDGDVLTAHFTQDLKITFEQCEKIYRISGMKSN